MNGVQIFDSDGRYLEKFDLSGYVFGLNFDLQDKLYTVSNDPEVMRLAVRKIVPLRNPPASVIIPCAYGAWLSPARVHGSGP